MEFKYDPKRFLTEDEARQLVDLVHQTLGLNLRGYINDQDAQDLMRFMPIHSACKEAREKMGITIKQAAEQTKVQQYRLKGAEGESGGDVTREALDQYIDFLGIRPWFNTWLKVNRDVYERLKLESPKPFQKAKKIK